MAPQRRGNSNELGRIFVGETMGEESPGRRGAWVSVVLQG